MTPEAMDAVVETLLRDALRPEDIMAWSPGIHAVKARFESLPSLRHVVSPTHRVEDLIRAVEERDAKVLFVKPLTMAPSLPTVDLRDLAAQLTIRSWAHRATLGLRRLPFCALREARRRLSHEQIVS
jgi:hypothetical protein